MFTSHPDSRGRAPKDAPAEPAWRCADGGAALDGASGVPYAHHTLLDPASTPVRVNSACVPRGGLDFGSVGVDGALFQEIVSWLQAIYHFVTTTLAPVLNPLAGGG